MISVCQNVFTVDNLHKAYLTCRKGKRGAIHTRGFETKLFQELQGLSDSLVNGSYRPSRSVCFYVTKPKLREIFAANFRDRVVHRLLVDILEPVYEKKFIYDSYACRVDKGTHKAVGRVKDFVSRGTKKSKSHFYYLQLDIKGFFMEIHKPTLLNVLSKTISKGTLYDLCSVIVNHNPAKHFIYKGKIPKKGLLPPHKTLFHEDTEKGIPIGNLTSQFFANIYLNELDQYCKRSLGVTYYELYGEGIAEVAKYFQMKPKYRGNLKTFGFPIKKTKYAKNWLNQVVRFCNQTYTSYVIFTQSDEIVENVKIRMPVFRQTQIHPIQLELFYNSQIPTNKRRNKNVSK